MYAVDRFMRGRRQLSWAALAIAALVLLDPQAARADPGVPVPPNELIPDRGKGAVSAADEDFLVKVRLAGLWEIPAGDMAQEKSGNPRIRAIGKDIAAQHEVLDKLVRDAAEKLDVELPDKPNTDQQSWLAEMRDADDGRDFDQIYIEAPSGQPAGIATPVVALVVAAGLGVALLASRTLLRRRAPARRARRRYYADR